MPDSYKGAKPNKETIRYPYMNADGELVSSDTEHAAFFQTDTDSHWTAPEPPTHFPNMPTLLLATLQAIFWSHYPYAGKHFPSLPGVNGFLERDLDAP